MSRAALLALGALLALVAPAAAPAPTTAAAPVTAPAAAPSQSPAPPTAHLAIGPAESVQVEATAEVPPEPRVLAAAQSPAQPPPADPTGDPTPASSAEALLVAALAGGAAELPCDISPRVPGDSVLLVVWYRGDAPIYSWDARAEEGPGEGGAHWSGAPGARARWSALGARLSLRPARAPDRGEYRCRADFRASPTRITRVSLQVIEPPGAPRISDAQGRELRGRAGPYREGDTPQLMCSAEGGFPAATLRWYRGGRALAEAGGASGALRLPPLRRADLLAALTCQASNSPLLPAATATVLVDMELPPAAVELLEREALSAGRPQLLGCRARGGRPPPLLSWWLAGERLDSTQADEEGSGTDGSSSTSTLRFTPSAQQHSQRLTCRAEHALLATPLEAHLSLDVLFAPTVSLALGANLNPNDIEEGDDVYFECSVRANPPPYKLLWEHNGKPLAPDARAGVRASGGNLVLRGVTRAAAGAYSCSASNVEGDARSAPVALQIMYKPVCAPGLRRAYGVARLERAQLLCEVDAVPPPDSWAWALNGSAGLAPVAAERVTSTAPRRSTLAYVPLGDADYGTALCWASNLVGRQAEPCALTLRPAAPPGPPRACALHNRTGAALDVACEPGPDGGLPQWFQLELYERPSERLLANVTARRPRFHAGGLAPGRALRLLLYAANARGRSEPARLDAATLPPAPRQEDGAAPALTPLLAAAGAAGTLLLLALLVLAAVRLRRRGTSDYNVGGKQKGRTRPPHAELLTLQDDKNPDVVPLNKASDHKVLLEEAIDSAGPPPPPYSRAPPTLAHQQPVARAGREVVTTRAPLPAAQESDV